MKSIWTFAAVVGLLTSGSVLAAEWNTQDYDLYPGDFNGDGLTDVLFVAKSASKRSGIALSNGSQWVGGLQYWSSSGFGINWSANAYVPVIGDFNYDGRDDILMQSKTPGSHYVLLSQADGSFTGIAQQLGNTLGGYSISSDQHRIVALKATNTDPQHPRGHKLFLQAAAKGGTNAIIATTPTGLVTNTVVTSWVDGSTYMPMNAQQANVYSGDFNGDGDGDLLVQAKPTWTLIDYDIPIPVPTFRPGAFGIIYSPIGSGVTKVWDHNRYGVEWSAQTSNLVIGDFNGDRRDDIVVQSRNGGSVSLVAAHGSNNDLVSAVGVSFAGASSAGGSSYRMLSANIDGTLGTGLYLQSTSVSGTDLVAHSVAGGAISTSSVGAVSQAPTQSERAFTTVARYNVAGQVTGTIAPDPDGSGPLKYPATRNTYGPTGFLVRTETGELSSWLDDSIAPRDWGSSFTVLVSKEFTYDSFGRKASEKTLGYDGVAESLVQYNYNAFDQVNCQAVRMNKGTFGSALSTDACTQLDATDRVSQFTFDPWNQLTKEVRGKGTSLQQETRNITYLGRLPTSYIDANGNKTRLDYDMVTGDLQYVKYPSPVTAGTVNENDYVGYTYDVAHNVQTERKRNGAVITNTWDANNRLINKDLSDNTYQEDVHFTYDLRGLALTSKFVTSGQGETNVFDGFGRLTSRTSTMAGLSNPRTLTDQYDDNGNRTRITHPDGVFFEYAFDGLNRVCGLTENALASSCSSTFMLGVTYQSSGHRYTMSRTGGANTTFVSDRIGRLYTFNQDFSGSVNDLVNTFTYNPASQIGQLDKSNDLYSYVGTGDKAGQYLPNGLNQYLTINGQSPSYDLNGNMTNDGAGAGYIYDMENRLVSTSGPASTLRYDPLGRLSQYTPSGGATTQFLYDGDAIVAEYQGSTMTHRYVHGDQVDEPWVQYDSTTIGASYRRYLQSDHQGSIIAQSDNTGGVLNKLSYDVFGTAGGSSGVTRFGYTGQAYLSEVGLNYYKARIYSPKIGRFLQTDPIGYKDDFNLYAYVQNDPWDLRDPTGLAGWPDFTNGFFQGVSDASGSVGYPDVTDPKTDKGSGSYLLGYGVGRAFVAQAAFGGSMPGSRIPDNHVVVRGGANITAESIVKGTSTTKVGPGFSANSAASVREAATDVKHNQIGVTTAGQIRAAGGEVHDTSHEQNPTHVTVTGLDPKKASELLSPSVKNPVPPCERRCNQ